MMSAASLTPLRLSRSYSILIVMLLYEAITKAVISAPVSLNEDGESSFLESGRRVQEDYNVKQAIVMPVWARKAGGNWRPELLQSGGNSELGDNPSPIENSIDDENNSEDEVLDKVVDDEDIDVQTESKAESSSTSSETATMGEEVITGLEKKASRGITGKVSNEQEPKDKGGDADEDEYVYDEWEPEEPECPEDKYFHIRGRKCVPYSCPGGNTWRDRHTGDCILKRYGYRGRWKNTRPWRP